MGTIPAYLEHNLRTAMSIELTTMPAYLYACWSIRPVEEDGSLAANEAASLIMSVVDEEMLHMGLAGNILNALGGTPAITSDPFLPVYPDILTRRKIQLKPVEFAVTEPPMVVELAPLSQGAIQVFMRIELPDDTVVTEPAEDWQTIGEFYQILALQLQQDDTLTYTPQRQLLGVSNPGGGALIEIDSREAADQAMQLIVEQGEGASADVITDPDHELAHYYKFREILFQLQQSVIDPARDVFPVVPNPSEHAAKYTPAQQQANLAFNTIYSQLLDALQEMFSSDQPSAFKPTAHFGPPVSYMERLRQAAAVLRSQGYVPGTELLAGPTFEYVPPANRPTA
jgi:hypothetical protein